MRVAERRGDEAIARGQAKAVKVLPSFVEAASAIILAYLLEHGQSSGELLVDACKLAGVRSTEDRHFGCVFRALLRSGSIVWVASCRRSKGHASRGGSVYGLGKSV